MPKTVNTVLGSVPADKLGRTLTHEHLIAAPMGADYDSTLPFDRESRLIKAIGDLKDLKAAGVSSIIDPIPMELGRYVDFMADASQASGVNIICATGIYHELGMFCGYPSYFKYKTVDELAEIYVKEITNGVGPRKVKPGVIKCATSSPTLAGGKVPENEQKALRAAARAHKATGVPITTHTTDGAFGWEQLEIFLSEGVNPRHVTIGHCSDSANIPYLVKILKGGAFIGFDRVGLEGYVTDEMKVGILSALVAMGFADQIVLSHDNVGCMHGFKTAMNTDAMKKRSYTLLLREFVPRAKAAGITDKQIQTMLTDNPRRFFEG